MKNSLLFPILFFTFQQSFAQNQHFQLELRLRVENNLVYCDAIAKEDYLIIGLQLGFYHNNDEVEFVDFYGVELESEQVKYNEICPKYVRMIWLNKDINNKSISGGDTLFTMVYQELTPQNHFICMMPSSGTDHCSTFIREALYADPVSNNILTYVVDDVCVDYQIQAGQIILAEQTLEKDQPALFDIQQQEDQLQFHSKQEILSGKYKLCITDNNGRQLLVHSLNSSEESISTSFIPSGIYFYQIRDSNSFIQMGKLLIH